MAAAETKNAITKFTAEDELLPVSMVDIVIFVIKSPLTLIYTTDLSFMGRVEVDMLTFDHQGQI